MIELPEAAEATRAAPPEAGPRPVGPEKTRVLDAWAVLLLVVASLYVGTTLGLAIAETRFVEQDAAHYCELAERAAAGEGLTSLADRRGPAPPADFPMRSDGRTGWPLVLAAVVKATGAPAREAGSILSLLALIATFWLGTVVVVRALGAPPWLAALCVTVALWHRLAMDVAIVPLTDAPSLLCNVGFLAALTARRPVAALLVLALAVLVRWQNLVLLLPLAWLWRPGPARQNPALLAALAGAGAVTAWFAGDKLFEGLGVALDPTHRDSVVRAIRHLTLPLVVGLWVTRSNPRAAPFWLLGLAHVLALLAHHDASDERPWLFANRHGLPYHFVAAALGAAAIAHGRGLLRWIAIVAFALVTADNVRRPYKQLVTRADVTGRPDLVLAKELLSRQPLGESAVVLTHDCDVLSYELGLRTVHLRGFEPDPPGASDGPMTGHLRDRGITHVLLTWQDKPQLAGRNEWMTALLRGLSASMAPVADVATPDGRYRALLLGWP